ncbi:MAG: hypothetical protein JXR77_00270 [Lentisphaeria bacterium]|nr:hypothetical protein [Lentisphaeria bacterium]
MNGLRLGCGGMAVWLAGWVALGLVGACLAADAVLVGSAAAFEAVGTLRRIDVAERRLHVRANGRDRVVPIAADAEILGSDGKVLPGGLQDALLTSGSTVTLSIERQVPGGPVVRTIRLGSPVPAGGPDGGRTSVGLRPLNEMAAEDEYKGEDGGLYGAGSNVAPAVHLAKAREQTARIVPRDREGRPAPDGSIVLVSISMSNATQEFSLFKQLADADPRKSARVTIVDCAQGGQAMAEWAVPDARAWSEADRRLAGAGVTPEQVQVAWIKLANRAPRGDLPEHGAALRRDTLAVLRNATARFPNLRIAYLGSRIYGGYARTPTNPEPYAYEGAFVVRRLILDQANGDPELHPGDAEGQAKVPLLLWGPYLWADGMVPRRGDGLVWERGDLAGDGTHPSPSGRRKVAEMLLVFFATDPLASSWFAAGTE